MAHTDGFPMRYDPFEGLEEDERVRCDVCGRAVYRDGWYYKVGGKNFCIRCEADADEEIAV